MKILIMVKERTGGVQTVVKNLYKEFTSEGHKVDILSRKDDLKIDKLMPSIIPVRKRVKELMLKERYDIIYSQDWSMAFSLLFPYPIYKKKHFSVFYGRGFSLGGLIQYMTGTIMGKKLIVCNNFLKKIFPKSTLIYNRVDINFFKPRNKKRKYLGWVNKKTETLTKDETLKIGKGVKMPILIAENIPLEKMNSFYNKCKIFLSLPPPVAGFGLVYLEAMAAGVPKIIGNKNGGGDSLPITRIEDFNTIGETINKAKKQDYRRWLIKKDFTWKEATNRLLNLFNL